MGEFLETEHLPSLCDKHPILVDPMEIKYLPLKDFSISDREERCADGDWDQGLRRLEDGDIYQAFKSVFFDDKPWNDTKLFRSRLQTTTIACEDDRDLYRRHRCEYLNFMFKSMREFGYVQDPNSDLVGLLIGRNGEVILNNGRHRVAVAQLLKIPAIPVTIDVRHADWVRFCDEVYTYSLKHEGKVYAPIHHIDLAHLKARQPERVEHIIQHMSPRNKTLVDLGANWGSMCQRLELFGVDCVAVENDPVEVYFLEKLKRAKESKFEVVQEEITSFISRRSKFDCVLMLSILHHVPPEKRNDLLGKIDAKELFFQFPSKNELSVNVAEWIKLILAASCFRKVKQIGPREDREMFHFTR